MPDDARRRNTLKPAGYAALVERYGLEVVPNWHRSVVGTGGSHHLCAKGEVIEEVYPAKYWPGEAPGAQLEFALKYDGTNLAILASIFQKVAKMDFLDHVRSKPTGKYTRRLWYLYELLTGTRLRMDDLNQGNYIDLLEPERYYTVQPGHPVRRQRINDNLLGNARFCPTVRRTDVLREYEMANLAKRCRKVVSGYPPELLRRASHYLYAKETKSSFEIEHIQPDTNRVERFVALLQLAEREDFCVRDKIIELQNRIVDPRFAKLAYRTSQNYVGETVAWQREKIHFVGPKPQDLPDLMEGWTAAHHRMDQGVMSAVAHAATVAYGFVFLHPFEDGNGRIHRFLIHNILARRGFSPEGILFPVSAAMQKSLTDYDASLEAFSRPLMTLVRYTLDEEGRMTVENDTVSWYRYLDMTPQVEALFRFIERTIDAELPEELTFLANYDEAKDAIQQIVDLPDRQIDLFIRFCLQNHGRLSKQKRNAHFAALTEGEISRMEQVIASIYGKTKAPGVGKPKRSRAPRRKQPAG